MCLDDHDLKARFVEDGYVIVPGLMKPEDESALRDASTRVIDRTRAGEWPHRRVVGRQFPPYDDANLDSWGVQHLMNPELHEPAFSAWYTSDDLVGVAQELLGCHEEELQMELFNLLINPTNHEFALRWHRDDVRETADEEEEIESLALWHNGVQWNTALYEDACLYVVPGSHKHPRTPEQRRHSSTQDAPKDPMDMPGALQVVLKPGETIFYNSNILHCATYNPHAPRATLHACMGDIRGGSSRARNILQHELGWMADDRRFRDGLSQRGVHMLDNLLKMRSGVKSDIGYSLS